MKSSIARWTRSLLAGVVLPALVTGTATAQVFSTANAINNSGAIAGGSTGTALPPGVEFEAFRIKRGAITSYGTFGGPASLAFGINAHGDVVGQSDTGQLEDNGGEFVSQAFLADDRGVHNLGTLPGHKNSQAFAINGRGDIAGWSYNQDPVVPGRTLRTFHAFLRDRGGTMVDLGTLGGPTSVAFGLNDRGQVVGQSRTAAGLNHAFVYERGRMVDMGTLGGAGSEARAINDPGDIAGSSNTSTGEIHAFLYHKGAMRDLGTFGGGFSRAFGINVRGEVVGVAETAGGDLHAFLHRDGEMIDLGTLGGAYSTAFGINNQGLVVGESETAGGEVHAFLWRNGVMLDLGGLP